MTLSNKNNYYSKYQNIKRNSILAYSDNQDYSLDCLNLENDQWESLSILKGSYQFIKIKIQDYFPLKIFFNVGAFRCNIYFSFITSQPTEMNCQKQILIKQQKIIAIQKPEQHKKYFYFSIVSDFSTSIKLKAWFQKEEVDRFYFLCYDGQQQQQKFRSNSVPRNKMNDISQLTENQNTSLQVPSKVQDFTPKKRFSIHKKQKSETLSLYARIQQAQQKKLQQYSQDIIHKYSKLLLAQYKQIYSQRMMKKYTLQWICILNFIAQVEMLYSHFKINKILRCLSNSPKVYAQRWRINKVNPSSLKIRVLQQVNIILTAYSNQIYTKIQLEISDLIYMTLKDMKFIKKQAKLQESFTNFYLKVKTIQEFYKQQREKFQLQMEQMIINIRVANPTILISKQRKQKILDEFYKLLCHQHKQKYNIYSQSEQNHTSLFTTLFTKLNKPKLNIFKHEKMLLELIDLIK